MAIYRRRDSRYWWISIYRGKGVPRLYVSSGTTDEDDARAIENALRRAHRGDLPRDRVIARIDAIFGREAEPVARLLLAQAWDTYAEQRAGAIGVRTLRSYRQTFARFVDWAAVEWPTVAYMHQVSRQAAFAYAKHLADTCATGKTANNHLGVLQAVFGELQYRAGLAENVWSLVRRRPTDDSKSGRAFTAAERAAIFAACGAGIVPGDWLGASLVAMYTGLRLGDIRRLEWSWIHADRLALRPSKTTRHKIDVLLPLHPRVVEHLDRKSRDDAKYVFPTLRYRGRIARHSGDFGKILEAASVDAKGAHLTFHCWRHTFRTLLAQARVSKDLAQKLGGWTTDISERYNHDWTGLRAAIDALP